MKIPGYRSIRQFAQYHSVYYQTVYRQMKQGYCSWPRRIRPRTGHTSHSLYPTWQQMVYRCTSKNSTAYYRYGGRGITVCEEWLNDFWQFVQDMGERPEGMTLDRINNDKGYSPENCRWATKTEQSWNHTSHNQRGIKIRKSGTFEASIGFKNQNLYIGTFDTFEEAKEAWKEKALDLYGYIP